LTRITQYHLFGFFPVELEKIEFVFFFVLEALLNQAPTNQDKTEKRKKNSFQFQLFIESQDAAAIHRWVERCSCGSLLTQRRIHQCQPR
jgi:hypothetical protein